jgi:hypothetical protein
VLDAVVEEIHVTRQRRVMRVPRRIPAMTIPACLGAAAAIGVLLLGGALILVRPSSPLVAARPVTAQASAAPVGSPTPSTIAESTPAVTSNPETVDSVARAFQDALNAGQLESAADLMAADILINNVVTATRDDVIAALGQICAGDITAVWSPSLRLWAARSCHTGRWRSGSTDDAQRIVSRRHGRPVRLAAERDPVVSRSVAATSRPTTRRRRSTATSARSRASSSGSMPT